MTNTSKGTIAARFLAEFALIVVGVLVALQVESWRDGRTEAARESEQLAALESDFLVNRDRYAETIADQERMMKHSAELLRLLARQTEVSPDSMARLVLYGALSWYEVEPVTGAYDALIASGDIGLIRDAGLRRELAEFFAELDAGFEDHENLMDILAELQRLAAPRVGSIALTLDGGPSQAARSDSVGAVRGMLNDEVFLGLLLLKQRLEENRIRRQEEGAEAVERVLSILGTHLSSEQDGAL
jgi:hypothetical protein